MRELERMENRLLPEDLDYAAVDGVRLEARQKLAAIRPRSLGQAGRVSGVSPADLTALMFYLEKREGRRIATDGPERPCAQPECDKEKRESRWPGPEGGREKRHGE